MSGDESALARALREDAAANAPGASAIDVAEATRRSRARRLSAQLALGAAAVVLVLGVGVVAVDGIAPPAFIAADGARDESAEQPGGGDSTGGEAAPSAPVARCGASVDDAVGDEGEAAGMPGLRLEIELPERAEGDGDAIEGTILIVNDGSRRVTGTASAPPTVVASRDGVARWTSAVGAADSSTAIEFDLESGESTALPVRIRLVACDAADDGSSSDGAPPPGEYELSAFLTVTPSTAGADPIRVTNETVVIVLE